MRVIQLEGGEELISFERFSMDEQSPIYQQIVLYLKRCIASGAVKNGDELPSRRLLSSLLGVNPNTVQKAYRLLEEEGLIESHAGAKSLVSLQDGAIDRIRSELIYDDARTLLSAWKQTGVSKAEALRLVEKLWEEEKQ